MPRATQNAGFLAVCAPMPATKETQMRNTTPAMTLITAPKSAPNGMESPPRVSAFWGVRSAELSAIPALTPCKVAISSAQRYFEQNHVLQAPRALLKSYRRD